MQADGAATGFEFSWIVSFESIREHANAPFSLTLCSLSFDPANEIIGRRAVGCALHEFIFLGDARIIPFPKDLLCPTP